MPPVSLDERGNLAGDVVDQRAGAIAVLLDARLHAEEKAERDALRSRWVQGCDLVSRADARAWLREARADSHGRNLPGIAARAAVPAQIAGRRAERAVTPTNGVSLVFATV